jgi:serine/threonine protein kinase
MSQSKITAREVFLRALDAEPSQRAALLEDACAGDTGLRRQVEALLRVHDEPDSYLDKPRVDLGLDGDAAATSEVAENRTMIEGPGTRIGPYELLEQIGEGGMGVVFMARQTEPVQRRVAVKIIKPGMNSRQVMARFEAERQASRGKSL